MNTLWVLRWVRPLVLQPAPITTLLSMQYSWLLHLITKVPFMYSTLWTCHIIIKICQLRIRARSKCGKWISSLLRERGKIKCRLSICIISFNWFCCKVPFEIRNSVRQQCDKDVGNISSPVYSNTNSNPSNLSSQGTMEHLKVKILLLGADDSPRGMDENRIRQYVINL